VEFCNKIILKGSVYLVITDHIKENLLFIFWPLNVLFQPIDCIGLVVSLMVIQVSFLNYKHYLTFFGYFVLIYFHLVLL